MNPLYFLGSGTKKMLKTIVLAITILLPLTGSLIFAANASKKSGKGCSKTYSISQRDFKKQGSCSKSLIIDKPGRWSFEGNVVFTPLQTGSAAIVIQSDNVVLDLCAKTLSQGNTIDLTTGIFVAAGKKNVTIRNGFIANFSQLGIDVQPAARLVHLGDLHGNTWLEVSNCGYGGQYSMFDATSGDKVVKGGIKIGASKLFLFDPQAFADPTQEVNLDYVISQNNSPLGVFLGNSHTTNIRNSNFDNNHDSRNSTSPETPKRIVFDPDPQAAGLYAVVSDPVVTPQFVDYGIDDLFIENYSASGTTALGTGAITFGVLGGYKINGQLINCTVANAHSDGTMYGFIFGGSSGLRVVNSSVSKCFGANRLDGYHQSGLVTLGDDFIGYSSHTGTVFENCTCTNNRSDNLLLSFYQFYPSDVTARNCISSENSAPVIIAFGGNGGFGLVPDSILRGLSYEGCKSVNDGLDDTINVYLSGFEIDDLTTGALVSNCLFQRLANPNAEINGLICDNFETTATPDSITNLVIQGNDFIGGGNGVALLGTSGVLVQQNNCVGNVNGIVLSPSRYGSNVPSLCNVIKNNTITNPETGIVDNSIPTNNYFTSNHVYGARLTGIAVIPLPPTKEGIGTPYPTDVDAIDNVVIGAPCNFNGTARKAKSSKFSATERADIIRKAKDLMKIPTFAVK